MKRERQKGENLFQLFFELLEKSTGAVLLLLLLGVVLSSSSDGLGFLGRGSRRDAGGYGWLGLSGGRWHGGRGRGSGVG